MASTRQLARQRMSGIRSRHGGRVSMSVVVRQGRRSDGDNDDEEARQMKAEWRRAGRATGTLICRLSLPAIDLSIDRRVKGDRAVGAIRRFLRQRIPEAPELLIGGSFVINIEFR